MTIPTLATPPATPQRLTDTPAAFVTAMDAWLAYEGGLSAELNTWATEVVAVVSGVDFNGTSASSLAIGTGSKVFTTQSGKLWQVGQFVIAASTATPANYMYGQVTTYSGTSLTVNVISVGGSGTLADWAIGLAPNASSYATIAGTETFTGKTIALGSNTVSGSVAEFNTALTGADFATLAGTEVFTGKTINLASNTLATTLAQLNAAVSDADLAPASGGTLTDPILAGTMRQDVYTIADGAGFTIDPRNGSIQTITLGASRTPVVANWADGDQIQLLVDDGTAYTIDWTTIGAIHIGGITPTLLTSGLTALRLMRIGGAYYLLDETPRMTNIAYVGGITGDGATSGSPTTPSLSLTALTGGIASSAIEGDTVIVVMAVAGINDLNLAMTTAGYTEDQDLYVNGTTDTNLGIYYKRMGTTPDTTAQANIPANTNGSYAIAVHVWRNVNSVSALDAATTTNVAQTGSVLVDAPASTAPVTSEAIVLVCGGGGHTAGAQTFSASALSNFISVGHGAGTYDATVGVGSFARPLASYNPAAWTFGAADNAAYSCASATLVLRKA